MRRFFTLFFLLTPFLSWQAFSATTPFPFHCQKSPIKESIELARSTKTSLLIIENISNNPVWLVNQSDGAGVDAGYDIKIAVDKSSALLLNKNKALIFQCIETTSSGEQLYPCNELVSACFATKFKVPNSLNGNFWAVEDSEKKDIIFNLAKHGIDVE